MNRPKRENFKSHIEYDEFGELEFNGIDDYYEALEKYCDELEANCEEQREYKEYFKSCYSSVTDENESLADEVDKLTDEVDKLKKALGDSYLIDTLNRLEITEKALDKACELLEWKITEVEYKNDNENVAVLTKPYKTKDQWKAWVLRNEE